jgi:hypothetical protein
MSLKVMAWAWDLPLPPTPKFVMMALADEANDDGYCFPSHRRIAKKCSINERSVRRMLSMLAADEYIAIKQRFNGRARTSNGYQLAMDRPRTNCPGGGGSAVQGDRTPVSGGHGHPCPGPPDMDVRVPTIDPLFDPLPPPRQPRDARPNASAPTIGESWGGGDLCFPGGLSEGQRRALTGHLIGLKRDDAQQILDELTGQMAHAKVHNPIRYCVALVDKHKRGLLTPELGLPIADRRAAERLRQEVLQARWTTPEPTASVSRRAIPPNARAMLDRFRGRFAPEVAERDSVGGELGDSNATDDTD